LVCTPPSTAAAPIGATAASLASDANGANGAKATAAGPPSANERLDIFVGICFMAAFYLWFKKLHVLH
jgi:hypothetical protein